MTGGSPAAGPSSSDIRRAECVHIRLLPAVLEDGWVPSERLAALADELVRDLGQAAQVHVSSDAAVGVVSVSVQPASETAGSLSWEEFGPEVVLSVESGGRWELQVDEPGDLDLLADVVEAVVAGRANEIRAPGRTSVSVVLADGHTVRTSVADMPVGCVPLPLWRRWGTRTDFTP